MLFTHVSLVWEQSLCKLNWRQDCLYLDRYKMIILKH